MNVSPNSPSLAVAARVHPRIRYVDPLGLEGADAFARAMAHAAELGFDSVMVPPPWQPSVTGDRYAPASLERLHPALCGGGALDWLSGYARLARQHGLLPMVDVDLATLAAEFDGDAGPFALPEAGDPLDPRRGAALPIRSARDLGALGAWWGTHATSWAAAGIGGLRLLGLGKAAGAVATLRLAVPGMRLVAWTPGLRRDALPALAGVDHFVSSLAWWDGKADWFWDELAALQEIAPVLACPEAPFGMRAAASVHDPALLAATLRLRAALAVATGDGWLVPEGFETGARRAMDAAGRVRSQADRTVTGLDLTPFNARVAAGGGRGLRLLTGPGASPLAVLRIDAADARFARHAAVTVLNSDLDRPRTIDPAHILSGIGGSFGPWEPAGLVPGERLTLPPGGMVGFTAPVAGLERGMELAMEQRGATVDAAAAQRHADGPRVAIEAPTPCVDDGALSAKRLAGEVVTVEADVVGDGHDKLGVAMQWHEPGSAAVHEVRMQPIGNDRYRAELPLTRIGGYDYTVQAWRDAFATYQDELAKKTTAGLDVTLELREGMALLQRTIARSVGGLAAALQAVSGEMERGGAAVQLARFLSPEFTALMVQADDRPRAATLPRPIRIDAERSGAAFASWYEVFPRSMSDDPARHGTFRDVERHLPRVQAMGFDVLYFPPVSPIGTTNRKGPNNTLTPAPGDPGSPYAIGSAEGGHDAIHPELGTLEDFKHLVAAAADHGLEIAIDFAIQCSPDHPWLRQHPDWFDWRPDGSIKYAENPPKKYQDIVNVDFYTPGAVPGLWVALAEAVLFWMETGVRLVRVDNPHTKPLPFWEWMIATVRARYPDAVFLAEAFTRPKVMYRLAKVGFSQSYTYFTWRETKREMESYLTELAAPGPRDFFRPHFFVNTPDINPVYLQGAPRSAYLIRAALAATLSGLWGVYNGFELCEGSPMPGREEYLDSEKYQIRAWDWDRPGNIVAEITALNRLRRANPALRTHLNTVFLAAANEAVSVFLKASPDRSNILVIAISFDPNQVQETAWEFPFWEWQVGEAAAFVADNVLTGERATWRGKAQFVRLEPSQPYAIWRVSAA